jgi:hypothetical protein
MSAMSPAISRATQFAKASYDEQGKLGVYSYEVDEAEFDELLSEPQVHCCGSVWLKTEYGILRILRGK